MISRPLYALLLVTALATVASQLYYSPPAAEAGEISAIEGASGQGVPQHTPKALFTRADGSSHDLFASQLPPPPPPPPVVVVAPPPPEPPKAPPLPYQYLGLMEDEGSMLIYLKKGENTLVTRVGEKLDDVYLVKRLDGTGIRLVYLPLGQEQLLATQTP